MVGDSRRTQPLLRAIAKAVHPGDVVLDIGTGLGCLAIAAAKAGAKMVWAIDCDAESLDEASAHARKAKVADRITFLEGLSFDADLPERADVILCETVGSFAFDENILATLSDAKRRLLKQKGRIIPCRLELWGAPCARLPRLVAPAEIARVRPRDLLAPPALLTAADLTRFIPPSVHAKRQFRCATAGTIRAVAVWPRVLWWPEECTDASPSSPPTHWKQGILPIDPHDVRANDIISFELIIEPHPDDPQKMTERLWKVF